MPDEKPIDPLEVPSNSEQNSELCCPVKYLLSSNTYEHCLEYCLLKEFLPKEVLTEPPIMSESSAWVQHYLKHSGRIQEICHRCTRVCPLKNFAAAYYDDCFLTQIHCVEIYKYDRSKKLKRPVSWEEALKFWALEELDDGKTYAARFRELWKVASKHLTDLFFYQAIIADKNIYQEIIRLIEYLKKQEMIRHIDGV